VKHREKVLHWTMTHNKILCWATALTLVFADPTLTQLSSTLKCEISSTIGIMILKLQSVKHRARWGGGVRIQGMGPPPAL
jgi:hypothetical protein